MMKKYLVLGFLLLTLLVAPVVAETVDKDALIAQLQAQIAALMQQLAALQGGTSTCYTFTRNLTVNDFGDDVSRLTRFLTSKGFIVDYGNTFSEDVAAALVRYQASVGISPASGYFGPITRANLNAVLGCNAATTTPSITIISPNGGESYQVNDNMTIRWNSSGLNSGTKIQLQLTDTQSGESRNMISLISQGTGNSGRYTWQIPASVPAGRYLIYALANSNLAAAQTYDSDFSDGYITIGSEPTIQPEMVTVSGTISPATASLSSRYANFSPTCTRTDNNARYSCSILKGSNFTLIPEKSGYTFNPPSYSFSNIQGNDTINFVGTVTVNPPVNTCAHAPYQVLGSSGTCVWSCAAGTIPSNATGECVCEPGAQEVSQDASGRRICSSTPIVPTISAPSQPTVSTACSSGKPVATIKWTGQGDSSGKFWIGIAEGSLSGVSFPGAYYHKYVSGTETTSAGFTHFQTGAAFTLQSGKTYSVHAYNGEEGLMKVFTVPACTTATPNYPAQALSHEYLQFDSCSGSDPYFGSFLNTESGRTVYNCTRSVALTAGVSLITSSKLQYDSCPSGYEVSSWVGNVGGRRLNHCVQRGTVKDGIQVVTDGALQLGSCPNGYAMTSYIDQPDGRIFHCTKREIVKLGTSRNSGSWLAAIFSGAKGLFVR